MRWCRHELKIAVITTIYFANSHADVIVSRWLEPRTTDRKYSWSAARSCIASLYIEQVDLPPAIPRHIDIGRAVAAQHNIPLCGSVREALTLGGSELAVDAVLLIAEHGNYPYNELGQKLYPRRELFDEIAAVFRAAGRSVPVFCDKHLSWDPASALHMAATARELAIPLMAGSSLPHAGFCEDWRLPPESKVSELVAVFGCGPEVYGYHSLEIVQILLDQGVSEGNGVRSICAFTGDRVWQAAAAGEFSLALLEAALSRCPNVSPGAARDNCRATQEDEGRSCPISPIAFCIERENGIRDTHLMLEGHTRDFAVAVKMADGSEHSACSKSSLFTAEEFFPHFALLNRAVEDFFVSRVASVPLERTLLTTLTMAECMRALSQPGERLVTPHISYTLPSPSASL